MTINFTSSTTIFPKSRLLSQLEFLYVVAEFIQCWKIDLYYSKISETPTYKP